MAAPPPSLTTWLARWLARPVDGATLTRARLHLLDWLGCIAGGLRGTEPLRALARHPHPFIGSALFGNVLEMDDVHRAARLHPGPVVWPAALMSSWRAGGTVGDALSAAVRGYEAMIRVGRALDARHYVFYHPTSTAGIFGALAASYWGPGAPEEDRLVSAWGLAGSAAGGLWQMRHEPGFAKQWLAYQVVEQADSFTFGWPVDALRGPRHILEGPQGLFAATCDAADTDALTDPSEGWRLHEVSFKPYPACRHAHPTIDAALELRDALGDGPIRVETYRDALTFCDRPHPTTPAEAKFSLQHAVAIVATRGVPRLADFEPDAIADPQVARARARVEVAEAADISAAYPAHFGARLFAGGHTVSMPDALGDPERPLGEAGLVAKTSALVEWGGLPRREAELAIELALHSPADTPLDILADLLGRWLR